jgi:hypothetical protein
MKAKSMGDHTQGSPFVVNSALLISSMSETAPVSSLHRPYTSALVNVSMLTFVNYQIKALILEIQIQYIHF